MTAKEAFEKLCESEQLSRSEWWIYWPFFKAGMAYQKRAAKDSAPAAKGRETV